LPTDRYNHGQAIAESTGLVHHHKQSPSNPVINYNRNSSKTKALNGNGAAGLPRIHEYYGGAERHSSNQENVNTSNINQIYMSKGNDAQYQKG
jgi:ribosomal protein S19E (S16A)